jgi:hypothetical protein
MYPYLTGSFVLCYPNYITLRWHRLKSHQKLKLNTINTKLLTQIEYSLLEILGTRSVFNFRSFFGFWNICLYIMNYLGNRTKSGQLTHVWYIPYAHTLKVSLYSVFNTPGLWLTDHMRSDVEFSTSGVSCQWSKSFRLWSIFTLEILNLYLVD